MEQRSIRFLILIILLFGFGALAETQKPVISINGFFDGYYSYNFNNPKQSNAPNAGSVTSASIPTANNTYRYYDTYHNQLSLSLVELAVKVIANDVSFVADLDFGSFADLNASSSSPSGMVVDESTKHLGQAIASYKPQGSLWIIELGKMYSHMGIETVKSKDNFNYSRSLLFSYSIPFWHTGLHLGYDVVPDQFQTSIYIYNGWNTAYASNRTKTVGAQIRYTPSKDIIVSYNFIAGPGRAESESDWKVVHEMNAVATISERLSILADFVFGSEDDAVLTNSRGHAYWYGGLLGTRVQLSDHNYISPRYEIYRDVNGFTLSGAPQTISSFTITFGQQITSNFDIRLEGRGDFSNEPTFTTDSSTTKSQTSILIATLFNF